MDLPSFCEYCGQVKEVKDCSKEWLKDAQKSSSGVSMGQGFTVLYRSQHMTRVMLPLILEIVWWWRGQHKVHHRRKWEMIYKYIYKWYETLRDYVLGRSLKLHVTSDSKLSKHSVWIEKSCDVKDLTADQFDISVPQLWYPADPSRYDRSGSARDHVSKE